jgi:aminoacrylate hydrolase
MAEEGVEPETCIREHLPWLFTSAFFENPARVEARVRALLANPFPQPVYALAHQTAACAEHDARSRIGGIKAPTLVLAAEEDILMPPALAEELAAGIPGARLEILESGAHDFREEIQERFNQAVLDFLEDIP